MRILFDHCTPAPLRRYITDHTVDTAAERGWSLLQNGSLLSMAEADGYDLLITTDHDMSYQQNLSRRQIALLLILDNSWPRIQPHVDAVIAAILQTRPGQLTIIPIPSQTLTRFPI